VHGPNDDVNRQTNNTTTSGSEQIQNAADEPSFVLAAHGGVLNATGGEFTAEEFVALFGNSATDPDILKEFKKPHGEEQERQAREKKHGNKQAPFAEVEAAVDVIPNDDVFLFEHSNGWASWEAWNNFGLAIYAATGGSDEGKALFHKWSAKYPGYNIQHTDDKWLTFKRSPPRATDEGIGAGSLFYWADKADPQWRRPFIGKPKLEVLAETRYFGERSPPIPPALVKGIFPQTGVAPSAANPALASLSTPFISVCV
jgi:hypothetical protein